MRRRRSQIEEKAVQRELKLVPFGTDPKYYFPKKLRGIRFSVGGHSPGFFSNAILQFSPLWKGLGSEEEPSNSVGESGANGDKLQDGSYVFPLHVSTSPSPSLQRRGT